MMSLQMVARSQKSLTKFVHASVVLPEQFFTTLRRGAPVKTGERQLLIAVLEDAVNCFRKHLSARNAKERKLFREAEEWLMTEESHAKVVEQEAPALSFEYVCEVLGLDPSYIRRGLQQWRQRRLANAAGRHPEVVEWDESGRRSQADGSAEPPGA